MKAICLVLAFALPAQAGDAWVITQRPAVKVWAITHKPAKPVKTCPCSQQCVCGCNEGKECNCNQVKVAPAIESATCTTGT